MGGQSSPSSPVIPRNFGVLRFLACLIARCPAKSHQPSTPSSPNSLSISTGLWHCRLVPCADSPAAVLSPRIPGCGHLVRPRAMRRVIPPSRLGSGPRKWIGRESNPFVVHSQKALTERRSPSRAWICTIGGFVHGSKKHLRPGPHLVIASRCQYKYPWHLLTDTSC